MLFLLFQLGKDHYALEASQVVEVLPLVDTKQVPQAPASVAGIFNYRGMPVPVIDLSELTLNRPSERRLSTRIILVNYVDETGAKHLLGLIVEKATETLQREPAAFTSSGITNEGAAYLGPVTVHPRGLIQWIEIDKLLPASVRDMLFREPVEST